ncbi:MAG: aldose epimerase family protein [Mariniphaga sp.]
MKGTILFVSLFYILLSSIQALAGSKPSTLKLSGDYKNETDKPNITKADFGETEGQKIYQYTLTNSKGMVVKVINYGASITDILTPDKNGKLGSVVLGFDSLKSYTGWMNALMGACVGRIAGRISNKRFTLDGKEYNLSSMIHGGVLGFHKRIWEIMEINGNKEIALKLSYFSKDGEEGFPGNLKVTVTYCLTNNNELKINYLATTDKATPVVLTNHTYFNLSGGKVAKVLNTELTILADRYLEDTKDIIPTGKILNVKGTPFDFTAPKLIGEGIEKTNMGNGYDLTYVLRNSTVRLSLIASAYEPLTGRVMDVYTTEPGLVFYTGNHLNDKITGRYGKPMAKNGAFCLETQHFPDSPNRPEFPNTILRPCETFKSHTVYKFSVRK